MVQTGFYLHKQAVLLEVQLNKFASQMQGKQYHDFADITMIYEQPVRLMREILIEMKAKAKQLNEEEAWFLSMVSERYAPYENCVLSQLEPEVARSLYEDLKALNEKLHNHSVPLVFHE